MRIFLASIAILFGLLLVFWGTIVNAQSDEPSSDTGSTPPVSSVNSYELFWPLVAGKTDGNSLYFLKLLKEQVRGWFIFDDTKRADYAVLLGTKRVLEVEELIKNNETDLALKSLERADSQFLKAYNYIKAADSKGKLVPGEIRRDRLINVKILSDHLKSVAPEEAYPGLDTVKEKADVILRDYLP